MIVVFTTSRYSYRTTAAKEHCCKWWTFDFSKFFVYKSKVMLDFQQFLVGYDVAIGSHTYQIRIIYNNNNNAIYNDILFLFLW